MRENTGKTKFILLGQLAHSPMTGYGIKKSIEFEHSHFWQESYGQIYPTLKQLEKEGLAECFDEGEAVNGRGQKLYRITEAGREVLEQWMALPPDVERFRSELLLKVSFGDCTQPEVILKYLDDMIHRNEKLVHDMEEFQKEFDKLRELGSDHTFKELTALSGRYIYSALRDWAIEAKKIITERNAK